MSGAAEPARLKGEPRSVLVLNGPNLNLLGTREPGIYGSTGLEQIEQDVRALGAELGWATEFLQSNHEGVLIDAIHAGRGRVDGFIVNPGGLTHTSVSLRDAFAAVALPVVEVHITNVHRREEFRHHSYISPIAAASIIGAGPGGYRLALRHLDELVGAA